jgi:hypothetical protein
VPEAFSCGAGVEGFTVSGFAALSLSLLDEDSDAFFAILATASAGHPASDTKTGNDANKTATFV